LPSIPTPDTTANPLRRAKNLVRLLADNLAGRPLLEDADALLTRTLNARMDGLAAEHAEVVTAIVADLKTVEVHTSKVTTTGQDAGGSSRQIETHAKDVDRDTALSLLLFGGSVLHGFSLVLVIGIIVGTFSSIFIASPILLAWEQGGSARRARHVALPEGGVR
jgi:hypothetical protein